jgi:hypothetical protein
MTSRFAVSKLDTAGIMEGLDALPSTSLSARRSGSGTGTLSGPSEPPPHARPSRPRAPPPVPDSEQWRSSREAVLSALAKKKGKFHG